MKTTDNKRLQKSIFARYRNRFFIYVTAYTVVEIMLFVLLVIIHTMDIFYNLGPITVLLYLAYQNPFLAFALGWALGVLLIALLQWRGITRDIVLLSRSIGIMAQQPDALIELPQDLAEVETVLRKIQYDNITAQRQAREADERKNDLVVYLAHDLKTPLTSVLGYLSLLRDEKDISPEVRQKYLSVATSKAQRLEDLINEFFEITRFSLKGLALEPTRFNFSRMLEQVNDEFRPLYAPKNITPVLDIQPDIELLADAGKLERVVDNLLRNAVSYSYPGTEIFIGASVEAGSVILQVHNRGDTIPPHKLAHIFEQFYRVDAARSGEVGGAGLGLAIAREIVELHGGDIWADSENEQIIFTVALPLAPEQKAALPAREPPPAAHALQGPPAVGSLVLPKSEPEAELPPN